MTHLRIVAAVAATTLLTACSSGGGSSPSPAPQPEPSPQPQPEPEPTPPPEAPPEVDLSGEPILIGVADSGFRTTHDAIRDYVEGTFNLLDGSSDVSEHPDHGTQVASVITTSRADTPLLLAKVGDDSTAMSNVLDHSVGFLA